MKYTKIALILSLVFFSASFQAVNTKTDRLIKFTINAYSTTVSGTNVDDKVIEFEKPIQVLKIDDNSVQMTKIKVVKDNDGRNYNMPIVDSNGNPEFVNLNDKKEVNLYARFLFNNSLNMKISGYDKKLQINIISKLVGSEIYWVFCDSDGTIKNGRNGFIDIDFDNSYLEDNCNSIFIIDEDLYYQVEKYCINGYVTTMSEPINPDNFPDIKNKKLLGWRNFCTNMDSSYFFTENAGLGFLEMNLSDQFPEAIVTSNGVVRGTLYPSAEMLDQKLYVDAFLVAFQLGGALEVHANENYYIFKMLIHESEENIKLKELKFSIGSNIAQLDGEKVELSEPPYEYEDSKSVMIALADIERFFNVKYHYRPTNNSLLIERFQKYRN